MKTNIIEIFYNIILKYKFYLIFLIIALLIFNIINLNKFKLDASDDTLILENKRIEH